ncbi:MAG: ATP-binding protein [Bacteroidia bacterium]|nr:ATP-binding protein [Bacteroidia bacterium]
MNPSLHKLLLRQLRNYAPEFPAGPLERLLQAVSDSYAHYERDREILERSMIISAQELTEANQRLRGELAAGTEAYGQLLESLRLMEDLRPDLRETLDASQIRLPAVAQIVKDQVLVRKLAEQRLLRQEQLLQAVAQGLNRLLTSQDLDDALSACMLEVVRASGADLAGCYQWIAARQDFRPVFRWMSSTYTPWAEGHAAHPGWELDLLAAHHEMLAHKQPFLLTEDTEACPACCLLPVAAGDTFWGCIGFFQLRSTFVWDAAHLSILANFAQSTGGAIYQHQIRSELVQAKEEAEAATLAKSQFLSIMSHEIRTPLNAVIGFTHLLLEDQPRPDQTDNLKTLKFSAENLLVLINDLLDYSKIESGKVELEETEFDLRHLVRSIRQSLLPRAEENRTRIEIRIDEALPDVLAGDPVRLGQILVNLASNAVKFTEDGWVRIQVRMLGRDDTHCELEIRVRDTGIGIEPQMHEKIFESFTQANSSTTRKFGGTGLGLAITRKLVELFQSRIELESEPGKGATFRFRLRMRYVAAPQQPAASHQHEVQPAPRSLAGIRVLVVEDNPVNVRILAQFLRKWDIDRVEVARNGAEGVEAARRQAFDLIFMDLQMPVMNGMEAAGQIRSFDPHTPIIALTADAMPEIRDLVLAAGMNDYTTKPFNPNVLYEKLIRLVQAVNGAR